MQYITLAISIAALAIVLVLWHRLAGKKPGNGEIAATIEEMEQSLQEMNRRNEPVILVDTLPASYLPQDCELMPITDKKLLGRVDGVIQACTSNAATLAEIAQEASEVSGGTLYRVILPSGTKLAQSKTINGAFCGFYLDAQGNIAGQADLIKVEQKASNVAAATSTVASVMSIASLVVGQYYMTQVSSELAKLNNAVSKIATFQEDEYYGKVQTVLTHVQSLAAFQAEVLANEEVRRANLSKLDVLEIRCTELLGQANRALARCTQKPTGLRYQDYESEINDMQKWLDSQGCLLQALYAIADLKYAFQLGKVSRDMCGSLLETYTREAIEARQALAEWHQRVGAQMAIDLTTGKRKRQGFEESVRGWFAKDTHHIPVSESVLEAIRAQSMEPQAPRERDDSSLFDEDVQLIIKDGSVYYLPGDQLEQSVQDSSASEYVNESEEIAASNAE